MSTSSVAAVAVVQNRRDLGVIIVDGRTAIFAAFVGRTARAIPAERWRQILWSAEPPVDPLATLAADLQDWDRAEYAYLDWVAVAAAAAVLKYGGRFGTVRWMEADPPPGTTVCPEAIPLAWMDDDRVCPLHHTVEGKELEIEVLQYERDEAMARVGTLEAVSNELEATRRRLREAERSIAAQQTEIERLRRDLAGRDEPLLARPDDPEVFPGEHQALLLAALARWCDRHARDASRAQHVLTAVLNATPRAALQELKRRSEQLDVVVPDRRFSKGDLRAMRELGFEVQEGGGHLKFLYGGQARYAYTTSSTPSDHRARLNLISDLRRKFLF